MKSKISQVIAKNSLKLHISSDSIILGPITALQCPKMKKIQRGNLVRVVATTPEKTHNQKFLTFETILNRFLVQFYPGLKNKKKRKKLPPLIYTVQVQYDDDDDDDDLTL